MAERGTVPIKDKKRGVSANSRICFGVFWPLVPLAGSWGGCWSLSQLDTGEGSVASCLVPCSWVPRQCSQGVLHLNMKSALFTADRANTSKTRSRGCSGSRRYSSNSHQCISGVTLETPFKFKAKITVCFSPAGITGEVWTRVLLQTMCLVATVNMSCVYVGVFSCPGPGYTGGNCLDLQHSSAPLFSLSPWKNRDKREESQPESVLFFPQHLFFLVFFSHFLL